MALYIDESDFEAFRECFNTAKEKDETVYLFRYYQSDYTCYEVAEYARGEGDWTILGTNLDMSLLIAMPIFAGCGYSLILTSSI